MGGSFLGYRISGVQLSGKGADPMPVQISMSTRGRRRANAPALLAVVVGLALVPVSGALATFETRDAGDRADRALENRVQQQAQVLSDHFSRARSVAQITANNPAFRRFYAAPGARLDKIRAGGRDIEEMNGALEYLEKLFPDSIGEACAIDVTGAEAARAVRGERAPVRDLSTEEEVQPFFDPTFRIQPGDVYQARTYLSPDTNEWSIASATPVRGSGGSKPAIVHFEITLESFRRAAREKAGQFDIAIVERGSGRVLVDSRDALPRGPRTRLNQERLGLPQLGSGPEPTTFEGRPAMALRVPRDKHNANDWVVVAAAPAPAASWLESFGMTELALLVAAFGLALLGAFCLRASQRQLHAAAFEDPLTGLPNRRQLAVDLEEALAVATDRRPYLLAFFDLDGFKAYNDTFGHAAGDALLVRMAQKLRATGGSRVRSYRMGGDEFCLLADLGPEAPELIVADACAALSEHGDGFGIAPSHGEVLIPKDADTAGRALGLADRRMYDCKDSSRASAGSQSATVLLRLLAERDPQLGDHLDGVTKLSEQLARKLRVPESELSHLLQAAALHDIGKAAVPDAILEKAGALDGDEWGFIRRHTLIGERILLGAPALSKAAPLVRASHERWDGGGYPDGIAGDDIPLGARIIAVCDAYEAMTSDRPYRRAMSRELALAELRRCAGTQFDPAVVAAFAALEAESHVALGTA